MPPSVSPSTPSRPCCNIYDHDKLSGLSIAMAYVPWQKWQNIYKPENALYAGTIFQDLDLPFTGRRCQK